MELDITCLADTDAFNYSASRAEMGENAAQITWRNNLRDTPALLTTDEQREAARDHFKEYGAWSREEIWEWDDRELNALLHQDIMSAVREAGADSLTDIDWQEYENPDNATGGRLYRVKGIAPEDTDKFYFYLGI